MAGLENLTNTLVSSGDQRLTLKAPPSVISLWVTALLSTPTPTKTGSMETWVIQEAVIPFHSSPDADPTRARAFGIRQVTLLSSSASISNPQNPGNDPNVAAVRILIATTGVLPPVPVADLTNRLLSEEGAVTVMNVVQIPRSFLDALDADVRRSFLDDTSGTDDAEAKAGRYLEERGQKAVEPIVAALWAVGIEPDVRYVEGDDPAEAIIYTAEEIGAEIVLMGATRRLFTEEAWRSVSARVMDKSNLPVLVVPGLRIEDTMEMPVIEL